MLSKVLALRFVARACSRHNFAVRRSHGTTAIPAGNQPAIRRCSERCERVMGLEINSIAEISDKFNRLNGFTSVRNPFGQMAAVFRLRCARTKLRRMFTFFVCNLHQRLFTSTLLFLTFLCVVARGSVAGELHF